MLQVITINKSDEESNNRLWKDLLINAYNYTHKNNDYPNKILNNNLEEFWNYLEKDSIQIVLKQNKFIGFFINKTNEINKEISFSLFMYSQSCPMSSRSLIKCATIRSILLALDNKEVIDKIEFFTWHPSLVHVVKTILPITTHMITSNHIICYFSFENNSDHSLKDKLKLYLNVENYHSIDPNNFKVFY